MKLLMFLVILVSFHSVFVESFSILAVFPNPMISHYTLTQTVLKELVKRGHQVTVISPYPQKTLIENFTDISIESIVPILTERKKKLYKLETSTVVSNVNFLTATGYKITELCIEHPNVQELLRSNQSFDLVMTALFMNDATMAFAHHYKVPTVILVSMPPFAWGSHILGHHEPSSYVPNLFSSFRGEMDFWQRTRNTFYDLYSILYYKFVMLPKHAELVKRNFPNSPDLYEFVDNASMVLINSHASVYDPIPRPPNVHEIAGFHINPKPLPKDLQAYLDNSPNGVVVFSLGSNLKSSELKTYQIQAIFNALSKLEQNVLWKWERDELPGKANNIRFMKWLPLQDILAHPNVKGMISHGGLLTTTESVYHGVPMIGMPVFSDQKMNVATASAYGYCLVVPLQDLTEEKLSFALKEIIYNPKYREQAIIRSKIMKDRPLAPLDEAVYWIEYVVRHQGAPHLRYPGSKLNWFQRNLVDVVFFALIILIVLLVLVKKICQILFKNLHKLFENKRKKNN